MNVKLIALKGAVAGAGLTFAGAALAVHPDTSDRVLNLGTIANGNTVLNEMVAGSNWSDTWNFSLDGDNNILSVVGNKVANGQFDIDGLTLSLYDSGNVNLFSTGDDDIFGPVTLTGGDYYAVINGDATGRHGGMYKWILNVAAVPEAEAWLMMLGGLVLLGLGSRLRRSSGSAAVPS